MIKASVAAGDAASVSALARDGGRITRTIIAMGGYQSISGNYIRIDSSGDSEGNFTAFALKPHNYTLTSKFSSDLFTCGSYLMSVGEFHTTQLHPNLSLANQTASQTKPLPEYVFSKKIDWPKGFKPLDEPVCGYTEEKCQVGQEEMNCTAKYCYSKTQKGERTSKYKLDPACTNRFELNYLVE